MKSYLSFLSSLKNLTKLMINDGSIFSRSVFAGDNKCSRYLHTKNKSNTGKDSGKIVQNNQSESFQDVLSLKLEEKSIPSYNLPKLNKSDDVSNAPSNFYNIIKLLLQHMVLTKGLLVLLLKLNRISTPWRCQRRVPWGLCSLCPQPQKR